MSAVLPASAMRRVTCRELRLLGAAYRLPLAYAAARCARETKLYLHWTAGHYGQFFADYHVQIDADGGIYVIGDGVLDDVLADGLWLTIDITRIMTHGEAADNADGVCAHAPYGPRTTCERWDLEYLGTAESPAFAPWAEDGTRGGDILRGKAEWYREHK